MADFEPFKNRINSTSIHQLAQVFSQADASFPQKKFVQAACKDLEKKELKARVIHIAEQLADVLPQKYPEAAQKIHAVIPYLQKSQKLGDFDFWPLLTYIEKFGLAYPKVSLALLKKLTAFFSAEFALRPYLDQDPKTSLREVLTWTQNQDVHVRRLASEGSRPRLPWGLQLKKFVKDPKQTLPILEKLKYDKDLYVRKSVANHLNDITKDHPDFALEVASSWLKKAPASEQVKILWIVRHGLRGLIKKGNPKALKLLGFSHSAKIQVKNMQIAKAKVSFPGKLVFQMELISASSKTEKIVVDYIIHHQKANGTMSPKVFKLTQKTLRPKEKIKIQSSHSFKTITTRKYYAGPHLLEILVNGKILAKQKWTLVL